MQFSTAGGFERDCPAARSFYEHGGAVQRQDPLPYKVNLHKIEYTTCMNSKVAILKCSSYDSALVLETVKKAIGLLGGISTFVKPGSKVLVKPNLLMSKEPEYAITTHPEVVRSVIRLLKEINCKIFVGDSPSVWADYIENVDTVYERTGITKLCSQESVELVKFDKRRWRKNFPLTIWLDTCDYLVNVPKFKTHELTTLTGAIKNLFGLVCGTYKLELHKNNFNPNDFSKILVDIYEETRPALTVIDSIVAMQGDGPATSGKLCNTGLILAGVDALALDSLLAKIMNLSPLDILTNKEAASRKLGVSDINSIEILGEKLASIVNKSFELPTTSKKIKLPQPVIKLAKKLIKYYPCVEQGNCIRCSICIKTCPKKVITMTKKGIRFDYSNCIACFCCQEACPAAAIKVKKSLLAKIIGL
jgi:uncharacterized protein (DUF362 family)